MISYAFVAGSDSARVTADVGGRPRAAPVSLDRALLEGERPPRAAIPKAHSAKVRTRRSALEVLLSK
jgi:hypothetical protein